MRPVRSFGTKPATIAQRKARLVRFLVGARSPESMSDEQLARQHGLSAEVVKGIREGVGR